MWCNSRSFTMECSGLNGLKRLRLYSVICYTTLARLRSGRSCGTRFEGGRSSPASGLRKTERRDEVVEGDGARAARKEFAHKGRRVAAVVGYFQHRIWLNRQGAELAIILPLVKGILGRGQWLAMIPFVTESA